jgi:hypothetical protein
VRDRKAPKSDRLPTSDPPRVAKDKPGRRQRNPPAAPPAHWPAWLPELLMALALFVATTALYRDSDRDQLTDSNYTMLLSETLLDEHTFSLDRHFRTPLDPARYPGGRRQMPAYQAEAGYPYQIEVLPADPAHPDRPRIYHWYPAFPSVLAMPFVLAFHAQGLHATTADGSYAPEVETQMQLRLAAWLTALAVVLIYLLGRVWLPMRWAALLGATFAVATPLWSTASRAVWTSDWGLVLILAVLVHLARAESGGRRLQPWLIGTLAAFQYFCRPALAVEVLAVTAWVVWKDRRAGLWTMVCGGAWAIAFGLWSHHMTGYWLPNYYRHSGLGFGHFWQGFYGVLASPGRGVLVYAPFLLAALAALVRYRGRWPASSLVVMALLGTLLHAVVLALYPNWWGGHSFGSRLMIDTLPFLALACAVALACVTQPAVTPPTRWSRPLQAGAWTLTLALIALGTWIHWRGVTDRRTFRWNGWPVSIDDHPERALDWRMPPFLAGLWPQPPPDPMPKVEWNQPVLVGQEQAQGYLLEGWSDAEGQFRWTDGPRMAFCFQVPEVRGYVLQVQVRPYLGGKGPRVQRILASLNGRQLEQVSLSRGGLQVVQWVVPVQDAVLENVLRVGLPDSLAPVKVDDGADWRELGVAVYRFVLKPI